MRISDWSSDVCSSDLLCHAVREVDLASDQAGRDRIDPNALGAELDCHCPREALDGALRRGIDRAREERALCQRRAQVDDRTMRFGESVCESLCAVDGANDVYVELIADCLFRHLGKDRKSVV